MKITIDHEIKNLIPPLADEEKQLLEESILSEGCRDALVLWGDILADGHNRYEICMKHNLPFNTVAREFESKEDLKVWVIRNQFGRRNLPPYARAELALLLKESIAARAKENQVRAGGAVRQISAEPVKTRDELAKLAGMSHDTLSKADKVSQRADEDTKEKLRRGDITINKAYSDMLFEERKGQLKTCTVCGRELPPEHFYDNRNQCTKCRSAQKYKKKPEKLNPEGKTLDEIMRDMKDTTINRETTNDQNAEEWLVNAIDCIDTLERTDGIAFGNVADELKKEIAAVLQAIESAATNIKNQL